MLFFKVVLILHNLELVFLKWYKKGRWWSENIWIVSFPLALAAGIHCPAFPRTPSPPISYFLIKIMFISVWRFSSSVLAPLFQFIFSPYIISFTSRPSITNHTQKTTIYLFSIDVSSELQTHMSNHLAQKNFKLSLIYSATTCGSLGRSDSYKIVTWWGWCKFKVKVMLVHM